MHLHTYLNVGKDVNKHYFKKRWSFPLTTQSRIFSQSWSKVLVTCQQYLTMKCINSTLI